MDRGGAVTDHFDRAFEVLVGAEGDYINDPADPGGETKYGISKRAYPGVDIKALTLEDAKAIYRRDYWDRARCGELPWPLAFFVFDAAVNAGATPAVVLLQRLLRLPRDGIPGKATLEAAARANQRDAVPRYLALRALRYTGTRNFDKYGEGWLFRLFSLAREVTT